MTLHVIALVLSVLCTTAAQVLLRLGARTRSGIGAVINAYSMTGYAALFGVTLLMVYALQGVMLRTLAVWNATTFLLVPLAGWLLLGERLTVRLLAGGLLIVVGVVVYSV